MAVHIKQFEQLFSWIYKDDPEVISKQVSRYQVLADNYTRHFGPTDLQFFSTPGRTEIGGNHTDHNLGRVLAGSINLDSIAVAAANNSQVVRMYSEGYEGCFEVDLQRLEVHPGEKESTTALIRGVAARLKELGHKIGGFNACMTSDVLPGSGLSSSASVEVLIGSIFSALFNENSIAPERLAMVGQYAENNYFGKPCGLMDQVACAMGGIVTIDFMDPGDPKIRKVDFDFAAQNYAMIVLDTGGSHVDLTADYAAVPPEMRSVAEALGKTACREVTMEELMTSAREIREKCGDRALLRALHFLGDNDRVVEQVAALERNDFKAFLDMVTASGNSSYKRLQNIYSPGQTHEQGVSLALALTEDYIAGCGEGACRVHGGGFAGTIQVFLPNSAVQAYVDTMEPVFGEGSVHALKIRPLGTVHLNALIDQH